MNVQRSLPTAANWRERLLNLIAVPVFMLFMLAGYSLLFLIVHKALAAFGSEPPTLRAMGEAVASFWGSVMSKWDALTRPLEKNPYVWILNYGFIALLMLGWIRSQIARSAMA